MSFSVLAVEPPKQAADVDEACGRIPPLWPLQHFVAVNPFLGLSQLPFLAASRLLEKVAHHAPLMDAEYYRAQIRNGAIDAEGIRVTLAHVGSPVHPSDPISWLDGELAKRRPTEQILTVADSLDRTHGTNWCAFVVDEISKWCSSYFDQGQSSWKLPWGDLPLYTAWKQIAEIDANPEIFGLAGFRKYVKQLSASADAAIDDALRLLNIPPQFASDFLHRELMSIFGWSAFAAYRDRSAVSHDLVRQLLAIRLAYDTALFSLDRSWRFQITSAAASTGFTDAKYVAQLAAEYAFRSRLARKLQSAKTGPLPRTQKALQAVFCIDVRSEAYRSALEAQSPKIQTIGFAGFFGMPLEFASTARCPVLINPGLRVHAQPRGTERKWIKREVAAVWKSLVSSAAACFSSVELGGMWFGARLFQQMTRLENKPESAAKLSWDIPLDLKVELAAAALRNMSIEPSSLAQVVLFCGHGSSTVNNPYASSLDCGACGGHKGDVNARFAASLMNDPAVRIGLRGHGIAIPEDTVFVAGLHITTTDEVILFDTELLSARQRSEIEHWLTSASQAARLQRHSSLMPKAARPEPLDDSPASLRRQAQRRSADWSEVRPEWGLAGNAAFIAAPRSITQGLDLEGRAFLHDYNSAADADGSVLQLILTAPVVVASWINLQYYASTVNNRLYGSGNKTLHNVVGTFGVWEGNGGDLRTGLPMQSLHDGAKWMHEPLRLQVFVDAPPERIDMVLDNNPSIRELVENQWLHLMSIDGGFTCQRRARSDWRPLQASQ